MAINPIIYLHVCEKDFPFVLNLLPEKFIWCPLVLVLWEVVTNHSLFILSDVAFFLSWGVWLYLNSPHIEAFIYLWWSLLLFSFIMSFLRWNNQNYVCCSGCRNNMNLCSGIMVLFLSFSLFLHEEILAFWLSSCWLVSDVLMFQGTIHEIPFLSSMSQILYGYSMVTFYSVYSVLYLSTLNFIWYFIIQSLNIMKSSCNSL